MKAHAKIDDYATFGLLVVEEVFQGHVAVDDSSRVEIGETPDDLKKEASGHLRGRERGGEGGIVIHSSGDQTRFAEA